MNVAKKTNIEELMSDETGIFNLDDVTETLYRKFGGASGVADAIFEVFREAMPGSPTKERIAMGLLELSVKRNKAGMDTSGADVSSMTEEDILNALRDLEEKNV